MKKILITGANSYIGVSFENYMKAWPAEYEVDTVDMLDGSWREKDFSSYDAIFHVAGIAHIKETKENACLYYEVNRDLAVETAQKAKAEGVKQFVYLSSMSVYGKESGEISLDTPPSPNSNYGKSKLEAEGKLSLLQDENFHVAFLRPPMVYGKNCKGNYQSLRSFALKYRVFPSLKNERSMIYIDNLSEYVKKVIDGNVSGVFFPQNGEYVQTKELVKKICETNGRKMRIVGLLNVIKLFPLKAVKKVFGNLKYTEIDEWSKQGLPFAETVVFTEACDEKE